MKTAIGAAIAWAVLAATHAQAQPINAVVVLSQGEAPACSFGNVNVTWIIRLNLVGGVQRRYIDSQLRPGFQYWAIKVRAPIGATLQVSSVMQDTLARFDAPASPNLPAANGCFNVEGYSIGLTASANGSSEFDPATNEIGQSSYGLFYENDDSSLAPGLYTYIVSGCGADGCSFRSSLPTIHTRISS